MVMGADVTHPAKGSQDASYAAVVASHDVDLTPTSWNCQSKKQKGGVEYIRDMAEMTTNALNKFGKKMKKLPQNIIMVRDGVGEGQFIPVLQKEANDMKKACAKLMSGYKPRITFLVSDFSELSLKG